MVLGMPNVGKSTTINALRNLGISGRKWLIRFLIPVKCLYLSAEHLLRFTAYRYGQSASNFRSSWVDKDSLYAP